MKSKALAIISILFSSAAFAQSQPELFVKAKTESVSCQINSIFKIDIVENFATTKERFLFSLNTLPSQMMNQKWSCEDQLRNIMNSNSSDVFVSRTSGAMMADDGKFVQFDQSSFVRK